MISVLFYVDNDIRYGAGHIARCCRLAKEFEKFGCKVTFSVSTKFRPLSFLSELNSLDIREFYDSCKYDLVVIDNYNLSAEQHKNFYTQTNKILVLDDLCNRKLSCDYLWDPTLTRKKNEYDGKLPSNCKLFLGGKFQIFSDQHVETVKKMKVESIMLKVAVHLYGGQALNSDLSELSKILSRTFRLNVLGRMQRLSVTERENMNIVEQSINPIDTFSDCRIGVGSPGNMLWERGSIGVPSYVFMNNSNQEKICTDLRDSEFLVLGNNRKDFNLKTELKKIEYFFNDQKKIKRIHKNLLENIDVNGKSRLVKNLLNDIIKPSEPLKL